MIGARLTVAVPEVSAIPATVDVLARLSGTTPVANEEERRVTVTVDSGATSLAEVVLLLDRAGVAAEDVALLQPTLDDVFFRLTGHGDRGDAPEHEDIPHDVPANSENVAL